MASGVYTYGKQLFLTNASEWTSGSVYRVLLVDELYGFSHTHQYVSSTEAYELSATGYERKTLSTLALAVDTTAGGVYFKCDGLLWAEVSAGKKVGGVVVYRQVGGDDTTPADDNLVCFLDTQNSDGTYPTTNGGDLRLIIPNSQLMLA